MVYQPALGIFNVCTWADACDCTLGLHRCCKRVCSGSRLWEKSPAQMLMHAIAHWGCTDTVRVCLHWKLTLGEKYCPDVDACDCTDTVRVRAGRECLSFSRAGLGWAPQWWATATETTTTTPTNDSFSGACHSSTPATSRVAWSSPFRAATLTTSSLSTCPSPPGNLIVIFRSVPFLSSSQSEGAELVLHSFLCVHTCRHRNCLSFHDLQGIHRPNGGDQISEEENYGV